MFHYSTCKLRRKKWRIAYTWHRRSLGGSARLLSGRLTRVRSNFACRSSAAVLPVNPTYIPFLRVVCIPAAQLQSSNNVSTLQTSRGSKIGRFDLQRSEKRWWVPTTIHSQNQPFAHASTVEDIFKKPDEFTLQSRRPTDVFNSNGPCSLEVGRKHRVITWSVDPPRLKEGIFLTLNICQDRSLRRFQHCIVR